MEVTREFIAKLDPRVLAAYIALAGVLISAMVSFWVSQTQTKSNARLERTQKELSLLLEDMKEIRLLIANFYDEIEEQAEPGGQGETECADRLAFATKNILKKREYIVGFDEFSRLENLYDANISTIKSALFPEAVYREYLLVVKDMRRALGLKTRSINKATLFTSLLNKVRRTPKKPQTGWSIATSKSLNVGSTQIKLD